MATAKSPAKKPAAKKTATRKTATATKKSPATTKKAAESMRSFKLSPEAESFISARITKQTIYWAVFAIITLSICLYILLLQIDILNTLEEIERSAAQPIL